jgi:hypothetical protein
MLCSRRSSFEWRSLKTQVDIQGRMTDKTETPHPVPEGAGYYLQKGGVLSLAKSIPKKLLNRKVNANFTMPKRLKTSRLKWNFGQRL